MAPEGISDVDQTKRDEERLAELGYKQELSRGWSAFTNFAISFTIISVLAGTLHDLRLRLAERRTDRGLDRLAGALLLRADGRLLDGGADLEVPDRGRPLLVGARPRRQGLELDDRLVQHRRPDRDRRLGRLRGGDLPERACWRSTALNIFGINFGDTEHILGETFLLSCSSWSSTRWSTSSPTASWR